MIHRPNRTVCAVLSPATCEETHLVFSEAARCSMRDGRRPNIASGGEHPKWERGAVALR